MRIKWPAYRSIVEDSIRRQRTGGMIEYSVDEEENRLGDMKGIE